MISWILNDVKEFMKGIMVIRHIGETFHLKLAPHIFSIMAKPSDTSPFIFAFQMFPPFFDNYSCLGLQYSRIDIDPLFSLFCNLYDDGFSALSLFLLNPKNAYFTFKRPHDCEQEYKFLFLPSDDMRDVGNFDWGTFISIDSQQFANIVSTFTDRTFVNINHTSSEVEFFNPETRIIFAKEKNECVIGGVAPGDVVSFTLNLQPSMILSKMARQSERIWLFKSRTTMNGVISAPIGLQARLLVYFPDWTCL